MGGRERLWQIREELTHTFLERSEVINGALAALLAGHHVLLIGPPGTAKSMLADELCARLHGATYFQHRAFADAIRGGAPPAVGVPDGLLAVAVGQAGEISAREIRPVELSELGVG